MSVKQRDIVLMSKNKSGEQTIDLPITRLGNIIDEAETKEQPTTGDYIPIMDMEDGGQMKKFPYIPPASSENGDSGDTHRFYQTSVMLTGSGNASNTITIGLNVVADISEVTVNGEKKKAATGHIKMTSFDVKGSYNKTDDILESSEGSASVGNTVPIIWRNSSGNLLALYIKFSALTDGDKPFKIVTSEIISSSALKSNDFLSKVYKFIWPFYFVEGL